jgi:hypothetical protein
MKTDGFGEKLAGATFKLYTDAACTTELKKGENTVTGISADGSDAYIDKDKNGTESNRPVGKVLIEKVPNGIYYMKETGFPTKDPAGNDIAYTNGNTYVVLVGTANLAKPTVTTGTPWADVLSGIGDTDITHYTGTGEDKLEFAIFQIDGTEGSATKDKAVKTPDIKEHGIMNTSAIERKVILRKVSDTFSSLEGAWFQIYTLNGTEVINGDYKTTDSHSGYQSYSSGVYFIDSLPLGVYYLHEVTAPTKENGTDTNAYVGNEGKWFILTVGSDTSSGSGDGITISGPQDTDPRVVTVS